MKENKAEVSKKLTGQAVMEWPVTKAVSGSNWRYKSRGGVI